MTKSVTLEVPGRVCLFGDKIDLKGLPVIAATVDATLTITLHKTEGNVVRMFSDNFPDRPWIEYTLGERGDRDHPLKYWCAVVYILRARIGGFEARVKSSIPIGKGIASSGAVSVALVRALNMLFELGLSALDIAGIAYTAEHDELAIPCGRMDQYAISYGGVTHIATCDPPTVTPLAVPARLCLVVGDTLEPRPLKKILQEFRDKLDAGDPLVLDVYANIASVVEKGRAALVAGDLIAVGNAMREQMAQERRINCVTPGLEKLCGASEAAGAYGAKLIGVGGGGCMVALCPPDKQKAVAEAIQAVGGKPYIVNVVSYSSDGFSLVH